MEAGQQFLTDVRKALLEVAPEDQIQVEKVDIYLGSNPLSDGPIMAFRIRANELALPAAKLKKGLDTRFGLSLEPIMFRTGSSASEKAASFAAAAAAALLSRELGIGTIWGMRGHRDGSADGWIELLLGAPVGPAFRTALIAVAAEIGKKDRRDDPVDRQLAILGDLCRHGRPDIRSTYLIAAARANDIPYFSLGRSRRIWQFGWGRNGRKFLGSACDGDGYVAFVIAKDKLSAKHLFQELGLPTPRWSRLQPNEDPARAVSRIGWPCVVKPVDSSSGDCVTTEIRDMAQLSAAISLARGDPPREVMIEGSETGSDYRLMVIDGRMFAAVRREPAKVIGDGHSSVKRLVQSLNKKREGSEDVAILSPVTVDRTLLFRLQGLGLSLDSIVAEGTPLILRLAANRSAGGTASDVTDQVHPRVRRWAEQLACTAGLRVTGIDYISEDISRDPSEIGGGFIEINATPGLQVLEAAGLDRVAIGAAVLGHEPGRIPVDLMIMEREAIAETLLCLDRDPGHAIAWPHGAEIEGNAIDAKGLTPFEIVGAVLRHVSVERCTIVWTCEEMCLLGLPIDRIRRTSLVGTAPEAEWLALLERISDELVTTDGRTIGDESASRSGPRKSGVKVVLPEEIGERERNAEIERRHLVPPADRNE